MVLFVSLLHRKKVGHKQLPQKSPLVSSSSALWICYQFFLKQVRVNLRHTPETKW